ncbi:ABC transporter permease [Natronospora cellulosivora (SeqCode)]
MKMFKAIFIANVKEYIRDKASMFWMLVFPLILIFIFGWMYSGSGDLIFNISFLVHEENEFTNRLIGEVEKIDALNVFIVEDKEKEFEELKRGNRHLLFEIPSMISEGLMYGEAQEIPVYYDSSNQQMSQIALSIADEIFTEAERYIKATPRIFELDKRAVQGEDLSNFDYIIPGILAMALMQLGLFGSIQFISLREKKIIRGLGATPLSKRALLGSEIILRLILSVIQTIIIIGIGVLVFDITIESNIVLVLSVVFLGCLTFISLGYLLTSFVKTVDAGTNLVEAVQFPMMFLSGVFFPYEFMPDFLQPVIRVLPLTYLGDALRQVMLGFTGVRTLQANIMLLLLFLATTSLLTVKFWRWE